jgi:hypothetical protein
LRKRLPVRRDILAAVKTACKCGGVWFRPVSPDVEYVYQLKRDGAIATASQSYYFAVWRRQFQCKSCAPVIIGGLSISNFQIINKCSKYLKTQETGVTLEKKIDKLIEK